MTALRGLWDFDDLDESERRFREKLDVETGLGRADVLAQLARVQGMRGRFAKGDALLDEAEAAAGKRPTTLLERGRLRRSSSDPEAALPLFVAAFEAALADEDWSLAADAAHMVALVEVDGMERWTERGMEIAVAHAEASYWRGPLLNNLGWHHFERGEYEGALDAFVLALAAREEQPEREYEIEIARYAVAKALRMLGDANQAAALLEQAVAWTEDAGRPDGWFHEELAETYVSRGRHDDAREQARLAIPLLEEADPSFAGRADRLRSLAGPATGNPP